MFLWNDIAYWKIAHSSIINCWIYLQEVKIQRSQERWDHVNRRLDQEEAAQARRDQQHHNAKINRIQHFQNLEEVGQKRKDVRIEVTDRHLSMFHSVPLC